MRLVRQFSGAARGGGILRLVRAMVAPCGSSGPRSTMRLVRQFSGAARGGWSLGDLFCHDRRVVLAALRAAGFAFAGPRWDRTGESWAGAAIMPRRTRPGGVPSFLVSFGGAGRVSMGRGSSA
jgi:hypothetical protein